MAGIEYMQESGGGFPYNSPSMTGYDPDVAPMWNWAVVNYGIINVRIICPATQLQAVTNIDTPGTAFLAWEVAGGTVPEAKTIPPQEGSYGLNGWFTEFITEGPTTYGYGFTPSFFFRRPDG